jgi:AAA15 family ATPase/GTPase
MFFELKNIGAIKQAKIELGKLTIICGKNNTGKTYLTYSVYGFLRHLFSSSFQDIAKHFKSLNKEKLITKLKETGTVKINLKLAEKDLEHITRLLSQAYTDKLPAVFSANADEFAKVEFRLGREKKLIDYSTSFEWSTSQYDAVKEKNSRILEINLKSGIQGRRLIDFVIGGTLFEFFFKQNFSRPFILAAERVGIQLFQKELDKNRSDLINTFKENRDLALLEERIAYFTLPIEKNIAFTRNTDVIKFNSFLKQEQPELITYLEDMLGIQYAIIDGKKVVKDKTTNTVLPHYMSSTSVRALFDLHLWLKHQAKKGDILFIDEPELNLHPENQLKMAQLLVRLINSGINVFITTHSDYILKHFNNLLMLANDFPNKPTLLKEFGYTSKETLRIEDVKAYVAHHDGTVSSVDIDQYGMVENSFDDAMLQVNDISNKIIFAIDNL